MLDIIDAHNHITDSTPINGLYNTYEFENIMNIKKVYAVNISVGIHPLYIGKNINFEFIENVINDNKKLGIGEVGLDRRGSNRSEQKNILDYFIGITNRFQRPISFHCVKSWGELLELVDSKLDRDLPCLFHGYSGSWEVMERLKKGNSFFSFSQRELQSDRIIQIIKSVPMEKLLIESDMLNIEYKKIGEELYLDYIKSIYKQISVIKNIPVDEFIHIVKNNFRHFLGSKNR